MITHNTYPQPGMLPQHPPIDEATLVSRATQSPPDYSMFGQVYEIYAPMVRTVIKNCVHNPHTTDELTQDTFLKAMKSIGRYTPGTNLGGWLHRIAKNTAIDAQKGTFKHAEVLADTGEDPVFDKTMGNPFNRSTALPFDEQLVQSENFVGLVSQLPPEQLDVVVHSFIGGEKPAEGAERLGIEAGAYKGRKYRAVQTLGRIYDQRTASPKFLS